jgi:hypothetical protein
LDEADETASAPVAFEYLPSQTSIQQSSKFMRANSLQTDWAALMAGVDISSQVPSQQSNFIRSLSSVLAPQ